MYTQPCMYTRTHAHTQAHNYLLFLSSQNKHHSDFLHSDHVASIWFTGYDHDPHPHMSCGSVCVWEKRVSHQNRTQEEENELLFAAKYQRTV